MEPVSTRAAAPVLVTSGRFSASRELHKEKAPAWFMAVFFNGISVDSAAHFQLQ
jgi:hypothetical protein